MFLFHFQEDEIIQYFVIISIRKRKTDLFIHPLTAM